MHKIKNLTICLFIQNTSLMSTFNGNNSSPEWSEPNVEAYFREVVKTPLLPTIEAEQELIKRIRA